MAAIGTADIFTKKRDFGAWLGLVRISKRGNRYLRMLFNQAARVVLLPQELGALWPQALSLDTASMRWSSQRQSVASASMRCTLRGESSFVMARSPADGDGALEQKRSDLIDEPRLKLAARSNA